MTADASTRPTDRQDERLTQATGPGGAARAQLDRLRADGWRYLVFPITALWWLDHYVELRRHLETTGRLLLRRDGLGLVYGLSPLSGPTPASLEQPA